MSFRDKQVWVCSTRSLTAPGERHLPQLFNIDRDIPVASIARPDPGRAFNLCDDLAAPPAEVVARACALLGLEPPPLIPFETAELSTMARSFYRDNKRVSNHRIKEELGVSLAYPDYKSGLEAILAAGG